MPKELAARLRPEEKQADRELWKGKVILSSTILGLIVIGGTCPYLALRPGPSEDKKWAMSILSAIVSCGVGHSGKRSGKPDERAKDELRGILIILAWL